MNGPHCGKQAQMRYAENRLEVFDDRLIHGSDGERYVHLRGWVQLVQAWMFAGMGASYAVCLNVLLWKAGNDLKYAVSLTGAARDLGFSRSWVSEMKGVLCRLEIIRQVKEVPARGVVLKFLIYDDAMRVIAANKATWQRRGRQPHTPKEALTWSI